MNYNKELMQNPNKAFEIGFKLSPELKNNVSYYMFMGATDKELQFKHINTRQYLKIAYTPSSDTLHNIVRSLTLD
mgnify:FL=1